MTSNSPSGKTPFNFRLSPGGKALLILLGNHMGLTRSGVIETAIRVLAKEQGIPGGHITREELEAKWDSFMEEDEVTRSSELENIRAEATKKSAQAE